MSWMAIRLKSLLAAVDGLAKLTETRSVPVWKMAQSDQDIRNRLLVARLPAMPEILFKLLELCQADDAGMAELAKLIANDAGMTSKVLNVANHAAYYRGEQKVGLVQALSILGADVIKTVIISESVRHTFNGFSSSASRDMRSFWKHALTTAVIAREVAKKMGYLHSEEAYLAGLLHDVGRLALMAVAPNEYGFNFLAQDDENLCAVEIRTLQISHAEAGAWLVERWNLDSFMADSILYHHEAAARIETAHALIRIVHLANWMANQPSDALMPAEAGALCQLSNDTMLLIMQGAAAQVKKSASFLGIDLSGTDAMPVPAVDSPKEPAANPSQPGPLTNAVLDMTLAAELRQSFARQKGDTQLLNSVRHNARILFDVDESIILLMNGGGQSLVAVASGDRRQRLAEFSISLLENHSGIAATVRQRQLGFLDRAGGALSVPEEQLLRIFGADCLVCIPFADGAQCFGVMVCGVRSWQLADLQRRERLLHTFGLQVGAALAAAASDQGEIDRRIARIKEDYRENAHRVVHEINNPLAIIKNYLSVLDEKLIREEPVSGELSILNEEIDRIGNILDEFSGAEPKIQEQPTDINKIIKQLVSLFRESKFLPASVHIGTQLSGNFYEIDASSDLVKQVLVNLLKNSVEALPHGGLIEVVNGGQIIRNGREVLALYVKDNGPGIPAAVLAKIFTPVVSEKPGNNRGLGLSIVNSLVEKMDGFISCTSSKTGTVFEILFPIRSSVLDGFSSVSTKDGV